MYPEEQEQSFFVREFYREDEDGEPLSPIWFKLPAWVLAPSYELAMVLMAIGACFGAECYAVLADLEERENGDICLRPYGVTADKVLIVTTMLDDCEIITSVITPEGELDVLAMIDNRVLALEVDDELAEMLGLCYVDEATKMQKNILREEGCEDIEMAVYLPLALYTF